MLKKLHLFILLPALSLMLSSCVKDDAERGMDGMEWTAAETTPTPVEFFVGEAPSLSVKAAPVGDISYLSEHNFGIVGFSGEFMENNVLIRSRARVGSDGQAYFVDASGERAELTYPFNSPYNYTFYAYYIGDDVAYDSIELQGMQYGVAIPDYGKVDVLCGSAAATPVYLGQERVDGFNAKYIRALKTLGLYNREHLPNIEMKHICTMINFHFCYEDEVNADERVYISRVAACGINYSGYLYFKTGSISTYTKGKIQYLTRQWVGKDKLTIPEVNFYLNPSDLEDLYFEIAVNYTNTVSPLTAVISAEQIKQVLADNGVDGFSPAFCYSFDVTLKKQGYSYVTELSAHRTN